jgi:signal transduction histidine kinase
VRERSVSEGDDDENRQTHDVLAARVEHTSQRLPESNAQLTTEMSDRAHTEAARMRLLRRLVVGQEEERRRIARDLHDDLGQRLTALRLTLERVASGTAGVNDASNAIPSALEMLAQIDEALDFLAWEVRPAALDELGLPKVLADYVQEWSRHAGIRGVFHAGTAAIGRPAPEVEATAYRIAQEALNNVAKHAHASSVNVLLEQRGPDIVLVVEDDGLGFRPRPPGQRTLGMTGMRERAAAVGGTLEIEPTPDGGTTILARLPISAPLPGGHLTEAVDDTWGTPELADDATSSVLTSLRSRLQELQHAVAARDEFIATVAHELRNPVSPLLFQLRLAIEKSERIVAAGEPVPADWMQSQLRRVEQRLHRLLETLDRLLDVSRLSTGRIDLQAEPVDLAATVRDVLTMFDAELAVARCTVTVVERGQATGSWDRIRLEQICRNLVSNAIRFGAGNPIEIAVDADQDFATLDVRDHGIGISPTQHNRIFERFERGAEQRSGGFGIGLWVVRSICAAMGGTISVESEPGEGARFTLMLPRRAEREPAYGRTED